MISTTGTRITYTGDGSTTKFSFPYSYHDSSDIIGYLIDSYGTTTKITSNYDFDTDNSKNIYPATGKAITSDYQLLLRRITPITQLLDLPDEYPYNNIELAQDKLTMIVQEASYIGETELNEIETTIETIKNEAAGSATAAAESETNAKTYMETAELAENTAVEEASEAANSAAEARNYAAALTATSTTSITIATGSQTLTTQSEKQFTAGQYVTIASTTKPTTDWMFGQVTAYSDTALTVNVIAVGGSGDTVASWNISIAGAIGLTPGLTIGTVKTLSAGSAATASISGTVTDPVLNLGLPQGIQGEADDDTNIDGGTPSSNYGGIAAIDLGGVS